MKFILNVVLFLGLLVLPFVIVVSPKTKLDIITWLSLPTWPMHGTVYSDQLFELVKPTYTLVVAVFLGVVSAYSKVLFITLIVLTTIASIFSAFWLSYLINAA